MFCPADQEAALQFRAINPPTINLKEFPIKLRSFETTPMYYVVENDGCINFPIVGRINIMGLTKEQAQDTIKAKIAPYF